MNKRIKIVGPRAARIRTKPSAEPRVDPEQFARALGATRVYSLDPSTTPHGFDTLRLRLVAALRSNGGRPGLDGADVRQRIPMSSEDWKALEALAKELERPGFRPTAGQVASQLVHDGLERTAGGRRGAAEPRALYVARAKLDVAASRRKHLEAAEASMERPRKAA